MGEVYLAEDTTLERRVALKVLPASFASDPARRARFIREAKAAATFNHPNIVTLHSVEEADSMLFLTMEAVDGKTLAELLPRNGFALDRFLAIAVPLAGALDAAHQRGIAHRDLKPSNVMVTSDGRVKVLDFGIAKAISDNEPIATGIVNQHADTITMHGVVVGTPAYMSPEQLRGEAADARSDIYSLGLVLFEMLTGQRPPDSGAVVTTKPSPKELRQDVPRELARVVQRCLAREPGDRYQSARDLQHDLRAMQQDLESGEWSPSTAAAPVRRRTVAMPLAGAALVVATIVTVWFLVWRETAAPAGTRLQNARQITSALDVESYPSWSPDGGRIAYMQSEIGYDRLANIDIWVSQVVGGEPLNLTKHPADDRMPSWSPDGQQIAFFSDRDGGWAAYTLPAIGGTPRNILPLPGLDRQPGSWSAPQWSADGQRLYVSVKLDNRNVVLVLSLETLVETARIELPPHNGNNCWDLAIRPDQQRFVYVEARGLGADVTRLWTRAVAGGESLPLTDGRTNVWSPRWSNDGRAIFYVSNRGGSMDLWRQDVADDGTPAGEAIALTQGVGMRSAAFSADGTKLAYERGARAANVWRAPILPDRPATWADAVQLTSERAFIEFVDLSPDGQQLALSSDRRGNPDLWLLPAAGGSMSPLATDPTPDWNPRWSPDGNEISFYAYRSGNRDVWVLPARGGPARQLTSDPGEDRYQSWSPDGREIAYWATGQRQTMIVPAAGGPSRAIPGVGGGIADWAPDGGTLVLVRQGQLILITPGGGNQGTVLPTPTRPSLARFWPDGRSILFTTVGGPDEERELWRVSLTDRKASPVTDLRGRRGELLESFATDGKYIYFLWREDDGDIWVMDVAR
jgi:Tol biopolymer transport system component